jgi:hypothetical protein
MAQTKETKAARPQKRAAKANGVQKNLYTYAAGGRVARHLESTQLNKFGTKGGTGFAAEDANSLNEKLRGIKVQQVGVGNAKNGADRISNGIHIQTKYFDTATRTVSDAFDPETGLYRYPGMQLEVPRDQYDNAVALMRKKIAEGKVPGVRNPDKAGTLVKEGSVTYPQAKNIARAGNVQSLKYDAKNNAVSSGYAFAIGFAINFARGKWEGQTSAEALQDSLAMGLLSAGTSFVGGVATSQLLRTQMARKATVLVRSGVKAVAKTEWGRIMVDKIAATSGKTLSGGAATNYVSKMVRSNVIVSVATTAVISGPDFYRAAFSKNTSWAQAGKNLAVNGVGVAAGSAGWMGGAAAGAAIGTAILPGVGTTIGTFVGGLIGSVGVGSGGSYLAKKALDQFVEDDAIEMTRAIEKVIPDLGEEYLMTQAEFDELFGLVSKRCTAKFLRELYAQESRELFIRAAFEPECLAIIQLRKPVILPRAGKVQSMLDDMVAAI